MIARPSLQGEPGDGLDVSFGNFSIGKASWSKRLHALEMELLDPDVRGDRDRLKELLHDDFVEFGSSGHVYGKQDLIDMITGESHAPVMIRDFDARQLAEDAALVTYRSVGQSGQEARRSSVWVRDEGEWKMTFHQGTRVPNSWGSVG